VNALELKIPPVVQVVIIAGLMWALAGLLPGLSFAIPGSPLVALGIVMTGVVVALLGVLEFRTAGTTVDPRAPEQSASLVVRGVYRVSRNPMYVGFLLMLTGWAVFLGNIVSLLLLPVFILYMNRFQIVPEEQYMREKFGEAYAQYQATVRRWL